MMIFFWPINGLKMLFLTLLLTISAWHMSAQTTDSSQILTLKGQASITNNGISFIPSFSLGKPATVLTLSASRRRFSFDPEFRFSLEGKPWSLIFIWRYKIVQKPHFRLTAGAHLPALSFRTVAVTKQNQVLDVIQNQRFISAELSPMWQVSSRSQMGLFYLYGRCLEPDAAQNTHFLAFRGLFSNIALSKKLSLRLNPQVFFLKMDAKTGYYMAATVALVPSKNPFSISVLANKAIKTNIATKPFDWSLSLNYAFGQTYKKLAKPL